MQMRHSVWEYCSQKRINPLISHQEQGPLSHGPGYTGLVWALFATEEEEIRWIRLEIFVKLLSSDRRLAHEMHNVHNCAAAAASPEPELNPRAAAA